MCNQHGLKDKTERRREDKRMGEQEGREGDGREDKTQDHAYHGQGQPGDGLLHPHARREFRCPTWMRVPGASVSTGPSHLWSSSLDCFFSPELSWSSSPCIALGAIDREGSSSQADGNIHLPCALHPVSLSTPIILCQGYGKAPPVSLPLPVPHAHLQCHFSKVQIGY